MSKYSVELVTNPQYFNYAYDFVCYSVFYLGNVLYYSSIQLTRPTYK